MSSATRNLERHLFGINSVPRISHKVFATENQESLCKCSVKQEKVPHAHVWESNVNYASLFEVLRNPDDKDYNGYHDNKQL